MIRDEKNKKSDMKKTLETFSVKSSASSAKPQHDARNALSMKSAGAGAAAGAAGLASERKESVGTLKSSIEPTIDFVKRNGSSSLNSGEVGVT